MCVFLQSCCKCRVIDVACYVTSKDSASESCQQESVCSSLICIYYMMHSIHITLVGDRGLIELDMTVRVLMNGFHPV